MLFLARLLDPGDFGLYALATLAILLLTIFRDMGLGSVLILRQDYDERAQGTVVTMMLALGLFAAVGLVLLAPLAAMLFDEPRLDEVLVVLSISSIFGAVTWTYDVLLQRDLEFRRRFVAQMAQTACYTLVAVPLALAGADVWSLVGGALAAGLVGSVVTFVLAPSHPRPRLDRAAARDAFSSGRGFIGQGILTLVRQNADYLVVGRLLGASSLGLYTMAYRLAELPYVGVAEPVSRVMFPGLSRMRHRGEDAPSAFAAAIRMVALFTCPLGVVLSAVADPFVEGILGEKWLGMTVPLMILGLWGAIRPLETSVLWLLNSLGHADLVAKLLAGVLVFLLPAFIVGAATAGLAGVAAVTLMEMVVSLPLLMWFTRQRIGLLLADQWAALRPIVLALPGTWVAAWITATALEALPALAALCASVTVGVAVYAVSVRILEPGLLRRAAYQLIRMVRRTPALAADTS
jgi:O-antigen/teichoic acid export membrane protein